MIAQMIVIGFEGTKEGDKWVEQIAKDIKREKVGGVYVSEKNVQSLDQLKKLNTYLKAQAPKELPIMVVIEHEGGMETPLSAKKGFSTVPSAFELAQNKDIEEVSTLYQKSSKELAQSGINLNLAPVLDVQPRLQKEQSRYQRSYSSMEEMVTTYALMYMNAMEEQGVIPAIKYFPTAGENLNDHFSKEADVTRSWRFEQLKPYYDLIGFGKVDALVVSHTMQKEIDPNNPAIFSKIMLQGLLRGKMHFDGIIIADNLRTSSFANGVDLKERVIRAIDAGVDVFVFTNYFSESASMPFTIQKIISDAIKNKELSIERIEESYNRISKFKQKLSQRGSHVN